MEMLKELLNTVLTNSSPGVVAVLLIVTCGVVYLAWKQEASHKAEREKLIENFQKQVDEERAGLLLVLDKYQAGQLSVIQALTELKLIIATIGAKL